jgi:hypothetical protein
VTIPGRWRLPTIGIGHAPAGLSSDGSTLVLEEDAAGGTTRTATRFTVVATGASGKSRTITLNGAFEFDALSPDGTWLYVIERFADGDPTHYDVRRLSVSSGKLEAGRIVDKRNVDEVMSGYAITQTKGAGGWVFTAYRGHDGAFIHALNTVDGYAFCIDLPASSGGDEAAAAQWGLALDADHGLLYAANAALGTVSEIGLDDFVVRQTGKLASAGATIRLAKFESGKWVRGGSIALGADGTRLYVLADQGVIEVRTRDLTTIGRTAGTVSYRDLAVSASGITYALDAGGAVVRLDAAGGSHPVKIPSNRYSQIVGAVTLR